MPPNEIDKLVEFFAKLIATKTTDEGFDGDPDATLDHIIETARGLDAASTLKALEAERDELSRDLTQLADQLGAPLHDHETEDYAAPLSPYGRLCAVTATLTARIKGLEEGLSDVANPIAMLQRHADAMGRKLDGGPAYQLSQDVNFVKDIARKALAASLLKGGGSSDANAASATCRSAPQERAPGEFQGEVRRWTLACFGERIADDKEERGDRLLEEVFEALQSGGYDPDRVVPLRDYVWGRPVGEHPQEIGGVMVTFAAYCNAYHLDMERCGEVELARVWTKVEQIRAKQAAKPTGSALPVCVSMPGDVSATGGSTPGRQTDSRALAPSPTRQGE